MRRLISLHLLDNGAAALIASRQYVQVFAQVGFHLPFGFYHKAEIVTVAVNASADSDQIAAGVPKRIQQAWSAAQFEQAIVAPGQMVNFLLGGAQ